MSEERGGREGNKGEKDGQIIGHRGELRPDVRIFLPYSVAKTLRDALNEQIKRLRG